MTTSEILRTARETLLDLGWHQGDYQRPFGMAVCSIGAINVAAVGRAYTVIGEDEMNPELVLAWETFEAVTTGQSLQGDSIVDWNDAAARTLQDVLDAFSAAIVVAEQAEAASPVHEAVLA